MSDHRGFSVGSWLLIGVCAVYVFSPIDLLPEALLGPLGLPDDVLAIGVAVLVALRGLRPGHRD